MSGNLLAGGLVEGGCWVYSGVGLRWWDPRVAPARWVVPGGLPRPPTWLLAWEAISRSVECGRWRESASWMRGLAGCFEEGI